MITASDILDALSKATAYDSQHTPKPHKLLVSAWVEHFAKYASAVTRSDLLEAVTEYHREPHDRILQPADLSSIARVMRRDRFQRSDVDSPQRRAIETASDTKATPRDELPRNHGPNEHQARLARVIAGFNPNDPDDAKAARYLQNLADSPLRVGCPWCKVSASQPCVIPGTRQKLTKTHAHPTRVEAAEKAKANT